MKRGNTNFSNFKIEDIIRALHAKKLCIMVDMNGLVCHLSWIMKHLTLSNIHLINMYYCMYISLVL